MTCKSALRFAASSIPTIFAVHFLGLAPTAHAQQVTNGKKPDLPAPFASKSANNGAEETKPPKGFLPQVPSGFKINIFAEDFKQPRWMSIAPNGDIFLSDSGAGKVVILRDPQHTGSAQQNEAFVSGLNQPYGIVFHDNYVYVADTDALLRFKYDPQTSKRLGEAEHLMDLPTGGHWTRSLVLAPDKNHLYIGIGSDGNIEIQSDARRAAITICDLDGKNARLFATGIRNPSGVGVEPSSKTLWTSVNERDGLGNDLPPDYFTSVKDGGFYGHGLQLHRRQHRPAHQAPKARADLQSDRPRRSTRRAPRPASIRLLTLAANFRKPIAAAHSSPNTVPGTVLPARATKWSLSPSKMENPAATQLHF